VKVGVLGSTGFVGKHLCAALAARGDDIVPESLRDPKAAAQTLAGCDVVVNLSGEPVAQRWTPQAEHAISYSRIELPAQFLAALGTQARRPATYIAASAIGYYGASETETFTESAAAGRRLPRAISECAPLRCAPASRWEPAAAHWQPCFRRFEWARAA
jgi:NAD dependent epimerase/dehydratase family enzyme